MKNFLCYAIFLIAALIGGSCLTSCNTSDDNPSPAPEVTLEDALTDGNVVAMAFNLNGEDFYVAFVRVGDTYELLDFDKAQTRAEEPVIMEKDCEFSMVHDKDNNQIKFTVKEKKTSGLVLTAVIDIKQSTMEVTPGDPKYKIKVEVSYYWERSKTPTVFTFTNEGGTFSCKTTGYNNDTFEKGSLRSEGNLLRFSVINNVNPYCSLEIDFNVPNMSYKFFTVFHDYYDSFNISVNDTDITSNIKRE